MPPVGAAVGGLASMFGIGGGAAAAGGIMAGLGGSLVRIGAGVGLSYVAKALAGEPDYDGREDVGGTQIQIQSGGKVPRWFMVGRWGTGGQIVYAGVHGDDLTTPNEFLVQVIVLSHLPVDLLNQVWVDDEKVSWDPALDDQSGKGQPINEYRKDNIDHLWIKFYDGRQTEADNHLQNKFPDGDRKYKSNRIGKGIAYAIVTSRFNATLFGGAPTVVFELQGLRLYDPTKDSTIGGSGGHRWVQPSTWEYTNNPVVIIYNLMLGILAPFLNEKGVGNEWVYGVQTITQAQLPYSSWAAAIAECNRVVQNQDGSYDPQFKSGGQISYDTEPAAEIAEFLLACDGRIADVGGVYKIKIGPPSAPIFAFTDDSLMLTDNHNFDMFPSFTASVNAIQATYVSPEEGWEEKDLKLKEDDAGIVDDGGRRSIADVYFHRVYAKAQVQRLVSSALLSERRFAKFNIVLPPEAYLLEPLDVVSWTSVEYGFTNKLFRVDAAWDMDNLNQGFMLTEVDPADWGWIPAEDEVPVFFAPMSAVRPPPQAIPGFIAVGVLTDGTDGNPRLPVIRTNWTPFLGNSDVDRIIFEVTLGLSNGPMNTRDVSMFPQHGAYDISAGIMGGTVYSVRASFDNANHSRDFLWTPWITLTTPEAPFFIEYFEDALQQLIKDGTADGEVVTRKVDPLPASGEFNNLYQLTLYGSGEQTGKNTGFYLFIDKFGKAGALLDLDQFAIGKLDRHDYPFVIENGEVKIARGNVQALTADQIMAGTITATQIKAGTIGIELMADGSIGTGQLVDGSVTSTELKDGAVTSTKIGLKAVLRQNIADQAINATKVADASITTAALVDQAVNWYKIADAAVSANKIAAGSIYTGHIVAGQVTGGNIAALAITSDKIAVGTITATNISGGTITGDKISAETIKVQNIKGAEISQLYGTHEKSKSVTVKEKGGVILVGNFHYKCKKGEKLNVKIYDDANKQVPGAYFQMDPGDDVNGYANVIGFDGAPGPTKDNPPVQRPKTWTLKKTSDDGDADEMQLMAFRVYD